VLTDGLGARLRDLRAARGITQRELAEPRYSRGFLAAVEAGHRVPTAEVLAYLADRLGVDPEDLRYGRPPGIGDALWDQLEQARRALSRGDAEFAKGVAAEVERQAAQYGLTQLLCYARFCTADVVLHQSGPGEALACFRKAAEVSPGGALGANVLGRISACLFLTGQTAASIDVVEAALRDLRAEPPVDPESELILLGRLVYPCFEVGAVDRARRAVDDGLALLPRVANREAVATFYTVACQVWNKQGRLSEVDEALNTARDIFAGLGFEREIGRCHWMRGYVLIRLDRVDEASEELLRARDIFGAVGARHYHGGATLELAEARRQQSRLDEAEALCLQAQDYVTEAGYDEGIAESHRLLGRIAAQRGDAKRAERLLNAAADRYAEAGLNNDLMRTCRELGDLLVDQGRLADAVAVLSRGVSSVDKNA
jgi:tetratricopeptide (TPR) repeat protein